MEKQIEVRARTLAEQFWDRPADSQGVFLFQGGSTPTTFLVRSGADEVVVKIGNPASELAGYQRLAPFLSSRLPRILQVGSDFFIREYIRGASLRTRIARHELYPERILQIFREVMAELSEVWRATRQCNSHVLPAPSVLHKWDFYATCITSILASNLPITVGGRRPREGAVTLEEMLLVIRSHYEGRVSLSCVTHGQPFSGNIIVDDEDRWCLIDPKPETNDWVEDLARLGRVHTYVAADSMTGSLELHDSRADLHYRAIYPIWVPDWTREVQQFGLHIAEEFGDHGWLHRYLVARLFGFLREVTYPNRDREHVAPKEAALVALGEAVTLYENLRVM